MQLTEHIYIVASGDAGLSMTGFLDCNVYLIDAGGDLMLIDAGANYEPERMDAVIQSHGFSLEQIKKVILTHYHADHAAGAARLKRITGCEVYASEKEAEAIMQGDLEKIGLKAALRAGFIYPDGYEFAACPDVKKLKHMDKITLNDITLTMYATPGHSLEDAVLYGNIDSKGCLFSGDALFPGGKVLLQNLPDVCIHSYSKALHELSGLRVDAFFPGHREPSLNRGQRHIDAALKYFDGLLIPPQLL